MSLALLVYDATSDFPRSERSVSLHKCPARLCRPQQHC